MDLFGTVVSIVMGCLVLVLLVETMYFMFCCSRRVHGHDNISTKETDSQQKMRMLQYLCGRKRNCNGRRLAREDAKTGVCSSSSSSSSIKENILGDGQTSSQVVITLCPFQVEAAYGDIWQLGGLLGPPRLLFTIKEETDQDLDCEDGKSRNGRSCRTSRAPSNDFTGPVTPPCSSSPSFLEVPSPCNKRLTVSPERPFISSNLSLSPKPSSSRSKPLSIFMQEPLSPLSISPPRHTLASLFQAPPNSSPSRLNYPNRVYPPLGAGGTGGAAAGIRGEYCPAPWRSVSMQKQIEGIPILGNGTKLQVNGVETSPRTSWQPSSPLNSGRSSPFRPSSPFHPSPHGVQSGC